MKDYSNGKIYCIRSHQTDDIYIGSTIQPLARRMGNHKKNYKRRLNGKQRYITSFEIMKYNDCYIELLEKYPCEDKMELERKEGEYIRNMICINKRIEGRTKKEWYQNNREKIVEKKKQYQQDNREQITEYKKQYRQQNNNKITCECGSVVTKYNLSTHKKTIKHQKFLNN